MTTDELHQFDWIFLLVVNFVNISWLSNLIYMPIISQIDHNGTCFTRVPSELMYIIDAYSRAIQPEDKSGGADDKSGGADDKSGGADDKSGGANDKSGGTDDKSGGADDKSGGADDESGSADEIKRTIKDKKVDEPRHISKSGKIILLIGNIVLFVIIFLLLILCALYVSQHLQHQQRLQYSQLSPHEQLLLRLRDMPYMAYKHGVRCKDQVMSRCMDGIFELQATYSELKRHVQAHKILLDNRHENSMLELHPKFNEESYVKLGDSIIKYLMMKAYPLEHLTLLTEIVEYLNYSAELFEQHLSHIYATRPNTDCRLTKLTEFYIFMAHELINQI